METLKSGMKAGIFSHRWIPAEGDGFPPEGLSGEELMEWLECNGQKDVVYVLYYKQICAAILSDMLNFIYEALSCSAKGKLTVAYALLRKPLKENLFYLEWLLAEPSEMLAVFDGESLRARSVDKSFDPAKKVEVISKALQATERGHWIDAKFIYDLRYNKEFSAGMEPLFQKANHLITSFRFMETERSNFNFVFSDEHSWQSQWERIYSFLPILLFHVVQVVEALIANFAKRKSDIDFTSLRTAIGMMFWLERGPQAVKSGQLRGDIKDSFEAAGLSCPDCDRKIRFDDDQLLGLYRTNQLSCDNCSWSVELGAVETGNL